MRRRTLGAIGVQLRQRRLVLRSHSSHCDGRKEHEIKYTHGHAKLCGLSCKLLGVFGSCCHGTLNIVERMVRFVLNCADDVSC